MKSMVTLMIVYLLNKQGKKKLILIVINEDNNRGKINTTSEKNVLRGCG